MEPSPAHQWQCPISKFQKLDQGNEDEANVSDCRYRAVRRLRVGGHEHDPAAMDRLQAGMTKALIQLLGQHNQVITMAGGGQKLIWGPFDGRCWCECPVGRLTI